MNVGSLFSGIGGFDLDLGLERAGMRVLWQCEIDPFCERVLAQHWPDVLRVPDIRDVRAGVVPAVDVICGGFPCQDVSVAGRGEGIDGARSGLWGEMVRVVRELRPRYVIVENVPGLLPRGLGRVLGDLAESGYDAEWDCLPASAFGAPHIRDRVWIVAYPGGDTVRVEQGRGSGPGGSGQAVARLDGAPRAVADANASGREGWAEEGDRAGNSRPPQSLRPAQRGGELQDPDGGAVQPWRVGGRVARAGGAEWWAVEPPVRRVAHGVPDRLDRCASLGNALVPQVAEWIGQRILEAEGGLR